MSTAQPQQKHFVDSDTSTPEMPLRRAETPAENCRAPAEYVDIFLFHNFICPHYIIVFLACACRVVAAALRKLQTPSPQIRRASLTKLVVQFFFVYVIQF